MAVARHKRAALAGPLLGGAQGAMDGECLPTELDMVLYLAVQVNSYCDRNTAP